MVCSIDFTGTLCLAATSPFGVAGRGGVAELQRRQVRLVARRAAARRTWSPRRTARAAAPWRADRACRCARPCSAPSRRLACCSAAFELTPERLVEQQRAVDHSALPRARRLPAAWRRRGRAQRIVDQAREAVAALDRLVVLEAQLRAWCTSGCAGRAASAGSPRRASGRAACPRACPSPSRVKNTLACDRSGETSTDGDGEHADARIAQLEADQLGELPLDLVGEPLRATLASLHGTSKTDAKASARPRRPRTPRTGRLP